VMFGQPVPALTQPLRMLSEIDRIAKGLRGVAAFHNKRKIQDRKRDHPGYGRRLGPYWPSGR